jgi:hypothetical protein
VDATDMLSASALWMYCVLRLLLFGASAIDNFTKSTRKKDQREKKRQMEVIA